MNNLRYILPGTMALMLCISGFYACKQASSGQDDTPVDETMEASYQEPHRPQFHFSPPEKWMNDPNGMVYYEGEYHLFYQYYPDSTVWGPMHWGHAVSKDMVSWENLPIALYPDELGYIFSGSAVIDWKNTSGFAKDGAPPMIAIFTHHEPKGAESGSTTYQYQSIAYSNDKGRSWTKYEGNPVVPNPGIKDFRDPKVSWHEASQQWVMVFAAWDMVKFYGSPDLKSWTHLSDWGKNYGDHGGVWECPDLFPLEVAGTDEEKWVLLVSINPGGPNGGSATQYFVGEFDGKQFSLDPDFEPLVLDEQGVWVDYGRDNYAGVSWSDIPKEDGRRLFLGWMSNWDYAQVVPTESWRSAMTLPRRLSLTSIDNVYRLLTQPVAELERLRTKSTILAAAEIAGEKPLQTGSAGLTELILELQPTGKQGQFGVQLSNSKGERYRIGYDVANDQFFSDRTQAGPTAFSEKFAERLHTAPRISENPVIKLHLFFDTASAELFADDGTTVMTDIFFPTENFDQIQLFSDAGTVALKKGMLHELEGIWQ